nr:glutaminase [uncultured Desulfobacter sp.]
MDRIFFKTLPEKMNEFIHLGKVADYIPALGLVPREKFGIAVSSMDGEYHEAGDSRDRFSLQSISKLFAVIMALQFLGDEFWRHIRLKLTSSAFNAISPIEAAEGMPNNPFTNGGAIAIVDLLLSCNRRYLDDLIAFSRQVSGNPDIDFDPAVAESEMKTAHRNTAIAEFLKSYGVIRNEVKDVLRAYCIQCSLAMSCLDLSRALLFLANSGRAPGDREKILTPLQCRRLNALMLMFGTYDAAGDFVFRVGLPGKSGVGGGISAIVPGRFSIAVWSPALDEHGTSVAGLKALEMIVREMDISIL